MLIVKRITLFKQSASDLFKMLTSREGIKKFFGVSLYRNAVYLILDGAIPAVTGFVFWVVAARLYSTENIGLASAAISANGLLVGFSILGLNNALIRFLPGATREQAQDMINSSFTVSGTVAVVLTIIFITGLGVWSPALISIRNNPLFFIMFVIFVPVSLFDTIAGIIYVANRRSDLILFQDAIASFLRFIPLVLFMTVFAVFGIFASWGLAILIATVIGIFIFVPITQKNYRPRPSIDKKIFGGLVKFSVSNYMVSLLSLASSSVLPLIVINRLGAQENAYFYISWTIGSAVATIPSAIATSLFAEGANDEITLEKHLKRALLLVSFLLIPLIAIILLFGRWLLLIFGTKYSQNGLSLLWVLTVASLPLAVNFIYFTVKRIQKEMRSVIVMTAFISITVLVLTYVLLPHLGLLAAGIGWLGANSAASLFIIFIWIRRKSLL